MSQQWIGTILNWLKLFVPSLCALRKMTLNSTGMSNDRHAPVRGVYESIRGDRWQTPDLSGKSENRYFPRTGSVAQETTNGTCNQCHLGWETSGFGKRCYRASGSRSWALNKRRRYGQRS